MRRERNAALPAEANARSSLEVVDHVAALGRGVILHCEICGAR
jgi:hypothetical protein